MSIKCFAFFKQSICSVKFIQNSKASIVDIESLMVVIMIFIGRQKWQMIARMAIYCEHIGDNMPNPYGNWGAKYLVFLSSRSLKTRENILVLLSLYIF